MYVSIPCEILDAQNVPTNVANAKNIVLYNMQTPNQFIISANCKYFPISPRFNNNIIIKFTKNGITYIAIPVKTFVIYSFFFDSGSP